MFSSNHSLDPSDWPQTHQQGRVMLARMLHYLESIEERPVWQPATPEATLAFEQPLPLSGSSLEETFQTFESSILPFAIGNAHPGFMGWAHGGGNVVGMLAEMLAAGLNANLGGRDHIPIAVEGQVVRWMSELFGFPADASGLFVTGSSIANFMGLTIARTRACGATVRRTGVQPDRHPLVAYTSTEAHGCIAQAMELAGIGSNQLRRIAIDEKRRMNIAALESAIEHDLAAGLQPFCIVGSAGTVDIGAVDDLKALADLAARYSLWFHIDGACGALGMLSERVAPKLAGIERADSIALDFHKWGQVPYDAGFLLVRDPQLHYDTFASPAAYLRRESRGMAAGSPWPCDYGPDLSRSFKALKVWFTLQVYGTRRLAQMIEHTLDLAHYLIERVTDSNCLELVAAGDLNIVCFRYCDRHATGEDTNIDWNRINAEIVVDVQESGQAAPSTTTIDGRVAIRAAIFNHRTTREHIDTLIDGVVRCGNLLSRNALAPVRV